MDRFRDERGQVIPLVLLVLIVLVLAVTMAVRVGSATTDRARARTAADAAALAGATGGRAAADSAAQRNGGSLESFVVVATDSEATVRVGDERATARARIEVASPER